MIVDDDDSNRTVIREVLADAGYSVVALSSLDEIRTLKERPSLLILDGSILRGNDRRLDPNVPVLIVSAATREEIEFEARASHARGYLRKPFEIDELVRLVGRHALTA